MTKVRMRIRAATRADVSCMLQIERESYRTGRFTERQFRYLVAHALGRAWVAVGPTPSSGHYLPMKGKNKRRGHATCLGFLILLTPKLWSSARIYNIATARHARGKGVATALMNHAQKWARRHGYPKLHLEVDQRNSTAMTFYERMGFKRDRRLPDYYGEGKHGWRFVRE